MNGPPANPMSGLPPSSPTSDFTASVMYGTSSGSSGRSRSTSPAVADRALDHRADARLDVHVHADRPQRHHDVAEQDRRVDVVAAQRLQGDLGDQLGPGARLEHRDALADPAVLGQRPARLAHEPDRGVRHRLPPAGADEGRARLLARLGLVRLGVGHPASLPNGCPGRASRTRGHARREGRVYRTRGAGPATRRARSAEITLVHAKIGRSSRHVPRSKPCTTQ